MNLERLKSLIITLARAVYALPLRLLKLLYGWLKALLKKDPPSRKNVYAILACLGVVVTARYLTNSAVRRRKYALTK